MSALKMTNEKLSSPNGGDPHHHSNNNENDSTLENLSQESSVEWDDTEKSDELASYESPEDWLERETPANSVRQKQLQNVSRQCCWDDGNNCSSGDTPRKSNRSTKDVDTRVDFPGAAAKSRKRKRREVALQRSRGSGVLTTPPPVLAAKTQQNKRKRGNHSPLPDSGSADFHALLQQMETPSPTDGARTQKTAAAASRQTPALKPIMEEEEEDEFGSLELSADDIAKIDSMILQATQGNDENAHDNHAPSQGTAQPVVSASPMPRKQPTMRTTTTQHTTVRVEPKKETTQKQSKTSLQYLSPLKSSSSQPLQHTTRVSKTPTPPPVEQTETENDDPFDDFDFEAMDKLIAERKQKKEHVSFANPAAGTRSAVAFSVPPPNTAIRNPRIQPASSPTKRTFLTFFRYKVVGVVIDERTFTKTLEVAAWTAEMQKQNDPKAVHQSPQQHTWPTAGAIHLRGEWYHTPVTRGDVIHICSLSGIFRTDPASLPLLLHTNPPAGSDNDDLVLIVHPDLLLTPTTISETLSCTRRAILKNRSGSSGLTQKAPLFGTMRHQLFEETMKRRDFSQPVVTESIQTILRTNAEGLLACGVSTKEAEREISSFVPQLRQFAAMYTDIDKNNRRKRTVAQAETLVDRAANPSIKFLAKAVEAVEEPAISPELGLKGNVDMILNAVTAGQGLPPTMSLFGVELKTGHNQNTQNAHMAQLLLYILMLKTRYGSKVSNAQEVGQNGMLLYLNNEGLRAVSMQPMISELKSLIGQRNLVAIEQVRASRPRGVVLSYSDDAQKKTQNSEKVITPAALPELLIGNHACTRCYANRECMMYAETSLNLVAVGDRLAEKEDLRKQFTGHLVKGDFEYFSEWDRLIDLEADAGQSLVAEAWLKRSEALETETGRCISSLVFDSSSSTSDGNFDDATFATISFRRSANAALKTPLSHLGLEPGCQAIVSFDKTTTASFSRSPGVSLPRMHIVRGFLHTASDATVTIKVSHDDLIRIQRLTRKASADAPLLFRLDRDNAATGIGTLRQNLINFFTGDSTQSDSLKSIWWPSKLPALRDCIVRCRKPRFKVKNDSTMFTPERNGSVLADVPPGCDLMDLVLEFAEMNPDQKSAIREVLAAEDYSLIQGLPGTGKSEVITFVARLLAAHGKRVLISAYTHSAVDNIMTKLMNKGVSAVNNGRQSPALIRVGRTSSCHSQVRSILASSAAAKLELCADSASSHTLPSAENLRAVLKSARIVGATALSIPRSPLLLGEHFDIVIVDEAGQCSQPAVLGALMAADSFVLVGDHMQLPPLVSSELAREGGFDVSLLKRLADAHPDNILQLTYQYRMHEDICQISNDLVYGGTLKCANEVVRTQQLALPFLARNRPAEHWLSRAVDPSFPVVFLDTDKINCTTENGKITPEVPLERASGRGSGGSIVNDAEAKIVSAVVDSLLSCGQEPSSIGVVCPFRAQIRLLEECSTLLQRKSEGLEISTIDRYQGRDKPAIILSFVRSNHKHKVGRLLEDVRRLNVAVTRAKSKLIMIGSFSTLFYGSDGLKPALDRVKKQGRVVELPNNPFQR